MARGVPLTPAQIETAAKVYEETGNYSEAARAIGADISATRKALIRHGEPERAKLHALALARLERDIRRKIRANVDRLTTRLESAVDAKDTAALSAQLHDAGRVVGTLRMNHAKLTGELIEHHDVTSKGERVASVVVLPALDADPASPLEAEPRPADSLPSEPRE